MKEEVVFMNGKEFVKKVLKNLCVFTIGVAIYCVLCFAFMTIIWKITGENESLSLLITALTSMIGIAKHLLCVNICA